MLPSLYKIIIYAHLVATHHNSKHGVDHFHFQTSFTCSPYLSFRDAIDVKSDREMHMRPSIDEYDSPTYEVELCLKSHMKDCNHELAL